MKTAWINGKIFDGEELLEDHIVLVDDGRIVAVAPAADQAGDADETVDLDGHMLAPGLTDIQVNGGGGVLFGDQPDTDTIRRIGAAHRQYGTTGFLPTLISSDFETMARAIRAVQAAMDEQVPGVLGIHLEGPFLNPAFKGIHDASRFARIDDAALRMLTSMPQGCMLVTIAPECTDNATITALAGQGVRVFAGHSAAGYEQTAAALQAGVCGFTHLFNAMTPFGSREPGMVGAALADRDSWFGIIADGQHVHPASFSVAVAAKARGKALLVTDAMPTVGSTSKTFEWAGETITAADGCCRLPDGRLAGSDLDMMSAVRNTMRFTGLDRFEALRMASTYPARALGLGRELGLIRPGYRASFIELDEQMNLRRTWIDGAAQAAGAGA